MQAREEPSSIGLTVALALVGGLIVGATTGGDGFFSGLLLGALAAQVWHLRKRHRVLREEVNELRRAIQAASAGVAAAAPRAETTVEPIPAQAAAAEPQQQPELPSSPAAPAATASPIQAPPPPQSRRVVVREPEPSFIDTLVARALAWIKGGNPLARVGIVILFFGGAFLAKYAADHSLFPIELRFALIAIGAFALLFVGWRLRDSRAMYAQILQGGGIAGLYLTFFAATKFLLLPVGLALALMILVALAGAVLAVAQNALSLAVIGTAGGFMAPLLVSTGSGNHIALFTYYALLNVGIFAVAWFRTWRVLNVLGFFFTFTITGVWRAAAYEDADLFSADGFLILFFLLYVGVSILNAVRQPPNLKGYVSGSLVFGLPVVAFSLHASLVHRIEYALAWSALMLGALYVLLALVLYRTRRETFRLLVEAFAALGVIFASLAIPLAFDSQTTAAMWAVEGAGLLWLGVRQARRLPRAFGALLQVAAAFGYVIGSHHAEHPILNGVFIGAMLIAIAGYFSGFCLYRGREHQARYERGVHVVFALWATAWWLFAGLHEIDEFIAWAALGAGLALFAATSLGLAFFARRSGWHVPDRIALYVPAVGAIAGLLYAMTLDHPFAEIGGIGWSVLLAAHFTALRAWDLGPGTWGVAAATSDPTPQAPRPRSIPWLHAGALWLITFLLANELSYQVHEHTIGVWRWLPWALAPAAALALLSRRELVPRWPIAQHARAYRLLGGVPLAGWICLWVLLVNLTQDGQPDWLPYVPLFNPLDITVAVTFVALALWWLALQSEASLAATETKAVAGGVAILIFVWLNAALLRALHHVWGAPLFVPGMLSSTLVQASLSIFWGLLGFAAMTTAAKKHWRIVWLVGAALMIVVVLKLFLIDLSKSGTLARIASFLTVGALLLITGYLAPLPPRREQESHAA